MMYITRDDKDTLIAYLQNMREHDMFLEGYQCAIDVVCDIVQKIR